MTTLTHAISGSLVAVLLAGVQSNQHSLLIIPFISAAIIDLDHLYYFFKDKSTAVPENMHKARSIFHELIGFIIIGLLMLFISFFNLQMAILIGIPMMIHLAEDFIIGISIPFNPFDKSEINLLPQKRSLKIIIEIIVLLISGFLWKMFLSGQL